MIMSLHSEFTSDNDHFFSRCSLIESNNRFALQFRKAGASEDESPCFLLFPKAFSTTLIYQ